ncbi:unnamed protein product, partial [Didymodactylos carnosus]
MSPFVSGITTPKATLMDSGVGTDTISEVVPWISSA